MIELSQLLDQLLLKLIVEVSVGSWTAVTLVRDVAQELDIAALTLLLESLLKLFLHVKHALLHG